MKILFKFASRSRPAKFKKCVENIRKMVTSSDYHVLVSADFDDPLMNNSDIASFCEREDVTLCYGNSINKVHAINRDIADYSDNWAVIINTSDDMLFVKEGFDDDIRSAMMAQIPSTDGVLHYNDGNQRDNVMTMSIIGRRAFDRDGYIYHPSYQSLWCDVEATEVAKIRGIHRYMGDDVILFRHLHPAWGLAESDDQYKKTEAKEVWTADEANFNYRKRNNFFA